jgi:NTP pyrophosphatase (non-canonical NTP hydrolase)
MKIYYIYRIPRTNKIGCTHRLKKRVEQEQGVREYEILYTTTDINDASNKEIEMQDKYGYKRDRTPYNKLNVNKMEELHITQETTTFKKVFEKKDFKEKYSYLKTINLPDFGEVEVTEDIKDFIEKKLKKSQFPNLPMYIYNETLWHYYKTSTATIFDNIRQWAKDKGILDKGDSKTQYIKLQEESGELAKALLNKDKEEIIDAIGDIVVVLTNLAELENLKIEDCIDSAYNIIINRTGKMVNGTFVKNE